MRLIALLTLLLCARKLHADSWTPFEDHSVASPRGTSSLELREAEGDTMTFVLTTGKSEVQGALPWIPSEVEVLESGRGAILFETWARGYGHGTTFARIDAKGKLAWKLAIQDLKLDAEWGRYERSDASIDYSLFWGVDGKRAFLVTSLGSIRLVDLEDGAVSVLPAADALAFVRKWALRVVADRSRRALDRLAAIHLSQAEVLTRDGIRMWLFTRPNPFRTEWEPSLLRRLLKADAAPTVRVALRDPLLRPMAISIASFMKDEGVAPVLDALAESKAAWRDLPEMQPEFSLRLCEALPARLPKLDEAARARTLEWLEAVLKRHPRPKAIAALDRAVR